MTLNVTLDELRGYLRFSSHWDLVRADTALQPHVEQLLLRNKTLTPELRILRDVSWWLNSAYTPAFAAIGILGNLACLLGLVKSTLRHVSPGHYLAARAGADSAFLLTLLFVWIADFEIAHKHFYLTVGWCQFVSYGSHLSTFLATWVTVALLIDRVIFVRYPEKRKVMCTVFRSRAVIVGLLILDMVVCLNISLTEGVVEYDDWYMCSPMPEFMKVMRVLEKLDTVVNFILPYTAVLVICILLRSNLCSAQSRGGSRDEDCPIILDMEMTRTSILVGMFYVFFTLPSYVLKLHHLVRGATDENELVPPSVLTLQQIMKFPMYLGYASTGILIVLSNSKLRGTMCHFIYCCSYHGKSIENRDSEEIPMATT